MRLVDVVTSPPSVTDVPRLAQICCTADQIGGVDDNQIGVRLVRREAPEPGHFERIKFCVGIALYHRLRRRAPDDRDDAAVSGRRIEELVRCDEPVTARTILDHETRVAWNERT